MNSYILLQSYIVNAFGVIDTSIELSHSNKFNSFLSKEFACVVTNVTETLND